MNLTLHMNHWKKGHVIWIMAHVGTWDSQQLLQIENNTWKINTRINKPALPKYASSCSLLRLVGKTVGIPGINVFSFSSPPHRDLLLFALLSSLSAEIIHLNDGISVETEMRR